MDLNTDELLVDSNIQTQARILGKPTELTSRALSNVPTTWRLG
jgi:hypothetical protein